MADKSAKKTDPEGEVSMEEILQSIRKIIAEEGDDPKAAPPKAAAEPPRGPVRGSDVLELTDMVRDDGTVVNIKTLEEEAKVTAAPPPPAPPVAKAPPAAPMAAGDVLSQIDAAIGSGSDAMEGQLISDEAASASAAAIKKIPKEKPRKIASTTPSQIFRSGTTVEDLVIESLKPMLKEWLDENLPGMVERIVEKEIKKITAAD